MRHPFRAGFIANLPVAASVAAYGGVLGVLAAQKEISWLQLLVMNLSVFAGSAQFVMVDMWAPPLPLVEMILAVMVINLRYLLIGASLAPLFEGKSLGRKLAFMHLVADENWAVTLAARSRGDAGPAFLLGGGVCVLSFWCMGTLTGHGLGTVVANPERYALDFVFIAVFAALAASLWRGRGDAAPWTVAILSSILVHWLAPGKWYIIAGGLGGALTAALWPERKGSAS